ncbi:MAG: SPOR domain-containing protein [Acidocella sp.]|nr:SPOR domain-containing protein [Acidocella sp.]
MNNRSIIILSAVCLLTACAKTPAQMPANTDSNGSPGTLNVADAAIAGGDPTMALSVSQSALQSDPNNVDALIHEGEAYYALGRCPAAEAAFNLAITHDPKSSQAETGLGRCLIKTDPVQADKALVLAVQDDPGNADALNDLGIARDLEGNFAGAVDPYRKALIAQPGMTAAEINLGLSLALSGNGQAALQYLGPLATSQTATPKIREDYAAALVATGQVAEARHVLSIDLPPDDVDKAIDGFNAIIANAQPPLPTSEPAAPPTTPQVQTTAVTTTSLTTSAPAVAPPVPAAPTPAASSMPAQIAPPVSSSDTSASASTTTSSATASYSTAPAAPPPAAKAADITAPPPDTSSAAAGTSAPADAAPPAATPPANTSVADTTANVAPGTYQVQLGALPSQAQAQHIWDKLSSANPELFGDKTPNIVSATVKGKTYYRLRTGSFASKAEAAKFCGEVSAAGSVCTLANF